MCDHCGCREFAPIAELTTEHEEILALAWRLAEAARAGAPWDNATADALLELLDVHAVKEETGLYPELRRIGGLSAAVCDELEGEHRTLHAELLERRFDRRAFYALAAHIEVEELELFSAAMLGFDEEEWAAMAEAHVAAGAAGAAEAVATVATVAVASA